MFDDHEKTPFWRIFYPHVFKIFPIRFKHVKSFRLIHVEFIEKKSFTSSLTRSFSIVNNVFIFYFNIKQWTVKVSPFHLLLHQLRTVKVSPLLGFAATLRREPRCAAVLFMNAALFMAMRRPSREHQLSFISRLPRRIQGRFERSSSRQGNASGLENGSRWISFCWFAKVLEEILHNVKNLRIFLQEDSPISMLLRWRKTMLTVFKVLLSGRIWRSTEQLHGLIFNFSEWVNMGLCRLIHWLIDWSVNKSD